MDSDEKNVQIITKAIKVAFFLIVALILLFGTFFSVPAGERGVRLTFGKASMDAVQEGLGVKVPLVQKVKKISVQTQKYVAPASSASKDLQIVSTEIAVNYHVLPDMVPEIYRDVGVGFEDRIIQPAVQEVVKATTAKFTAEELITRRAEVKDAIRMSLADRLQDRGLVVEDISITDFDFSKSFNDAIEAKVTAEQLKLKADRDLERIKIEAEQKVASAQAEAEALKLQKQAVTAELIQLRQAENQRLAIEKWDGVLPRVTGGAVPFIEVES